MKLFKPTRWGTIRVFQAPCSIFQRQELFPNSQSSLEAPPALILNANALAVLLVLYEFAKQLMGKPKEPLASVKIKQELLQERTGYSKNVITRALQNLQDNRFIKFEGQRKKYGEFGANKYFLCDSLTGEPFKTTPGVRLLYANNASYFSLPVCIVREVSANWSIARLSGSASAVYVALSWLANKRGKNVIEVKASELKTLCDFTKRTLDKALDELEARGLIWSDGTGKEFTLCDPYTGEPVHDFTGDSKDDPARYSLTAEEGGKRVNFNSGDVAQNEKWLMECLPPSANIIHQENGDLTIGCPFHDDQNPSCSVSLKKCCFHCFGCNKNGTLTQLVMKLQGISKAEAIQHRAATAQLEVEYHDPDSKAQAIYSYHDSQGKLVKQVLRYPDKKFAQRRPGSTGWVWDIKRVKPILYNLPRLEFARTVVITEGEKDADRVNSLKLTDASGSEILATTSGNSDSWSDAFAEALRRKRVVVMPDSDAAGEGCKEQVVTSLEKRAIPHCVVTFDGFKDVSEYLDAGHTGEELAQRIAEEWTKNGGHGDLVYIAREIPNDIPI